MIGFPLVPLLLRSHQLLQSVTSKLHQCSASSKSNKRLQVVKLILWRKSNTLWTKRTFEELEIWGQSLLSRHLLKKPQVWLRPRTRHLWTVELTSPSKCRVEKRHWGLFSPRENQMFSLQKWRTSEKWLLSDEVKIFLSYKLVELQPLSLKFSSTR